MEQRELLLLEKYAAVNPELKELWEDHILYEKQVEKLEAKAYRTAITNRKATNVVHRGQDPFGKSEA